MVHSTEMLVEQLQSGVDANYPFVAIPEEAEGSIVVVLTGKYGQGAREGPATLMLHIANCELSGEMSFDSHIDPMTLRIHGRINDGEFDAETYCGGEHWSDWHGEFDPQAGRLVGSFSPVSPNAAPERGTLAFDRGEYSPPENDYGLTGRWLGYYEHYGDRHNMEMDLVFDEGTLSGHGDDVIGPFQIQGAYNEDGHVRWKKMYIGQHDVEYGGIVSDFVIRGGWFLSGQFGSFELRRE
jgi:hypothetical protein